MQVFSLLAALTGLAVAPASAGDVQISDITAIPIQDGVNTIDHFAADGRSATVIKAWRDNGNAHGYAVYLVMMGAKDCGPSPASCLVAVDRGDASSLEDTATASPFDGERVLQTVRFAHAKVDGASGTVMIRADLGEAKSGVFADHAPAAVSVYVLKSPGVEVGTTPDVFTLAFKVRAVGLYCNADMALHQTLGLPLPTDYAGGKAPSGCAD